MLARRSIFMRHEIADQPAVPARSPFEGPNRSRAAYGEIGNAATEIYRPRSYSAALPGPKPLSARRELVGLVRTLSAIAALSIRFMITPLTRVVGP